MSRGLARLAGLLVVLVAALRGGARRAARRAREPKPPVGAVALAFAVSALGSVGFMVAYVATDGPRAMGAALAVAFAGLGLGLVLWSRRAMPSEPVSESRPGLDDPSERAAMLGELADVPRRRFLGVLLGGAASALGLAALFPLASLGPRPAGRREATAWSAGRRLVRGDGRAVRAQDLTPGEFLSVFPEGAEGAPDAQVVLIRLEAGVLEPQPGREDWSPEGLVAYSQLCTHAGCSVGMYQQESQQLFCPCHQSSFDVLDGARPLRGPAPRPLPQLPLAVDPDGGLRARAGFAEPVGPTWSERPA